MGRNPIPLKDEHIRLTYLTCKKIGGQLKELSEVLGVSIPVIQRWRDQSPAFAEAIKKGRDEFDTEHVEKSLLELALGYDYEEVSTRTYPKKNGKKNGRNGKNGKGVTMMTEGKVTLKHVPPHPTAIIFWLLNREPERWKNHSEKRVSGELKHSFDRPMLDLTKLNDNELHKLRDTISRAISQKSSKGS